MKINITQQDIDNAIKERDFFVESPIIKNHPLPTQACPIYQSLKRKYGDKVIGVSLRYIWFKNKKSYLLPKEAVDFIMNFDAKEEVSPFSFEVN